MGQGTYIQPRHLMGLEERIPMDLSSPYALPILVSRHATSLRFDCETGETYQRCHL